MHRRISSELPVRLRRGRLRLLAAARPYTAKERATAAVTTHAVAFTDARAAATTLATTTIATNMATVASAVVATASVH